VLTLQIVELKSNTKTS